MDLTLLSTLLALQGLHLTLFPFSGYNFGFKFLFPFYEKLLLFQTNIIAIILNCILKQKTKRQAL